MASPTRPDVGADPNHHPEDTAGVIPHGHGHRGGHGHRHGPERRHRHHPPQLHARVPGQRGAQGQAVRAGFHHGAAGDEPGAHRGGRVGRQGPSRLLGGPRHPLGAPGGAARGHRHLPRHRLPAGGGQGHPPGRGDDQAQGPGGGPGWCHPQRGQRDPAAQQEREVAHRQQPGRAGGADGAHGPEEEPGAPGGLQGRAEAAAGRGRHRHPRGRQIPAGPAGAGGRRPRGAGLVAGELPVPAQHDPLHQGQVPRAAGGGGQRGDGGPGQEPDRRRGGRAAGGDGQRLHLHHPGSAGVWPCPGHGRVPRGRVRAALRCPGHRRRRHPQPRARREGAGAGSLHRDDGVAAGGHHGGSGRVLLLGGRAAEAVPGHGLAGRHGAGPGQPKALLQRGGRGEGGAGRVGLGAGQGLHPQVRAVPAGRAAARLPGPGSPQPLGAAVHDVRGGAEVRAQDGGGAGRGGGARAALLYGSAPAERGLP
nr:inosine-5'-monophosphate dehydrogenase 1 isoform X3 [Taeniopygia guttata]XP_041576559.1 inosine-5'-monophosphate dehydrogenase 1 isoform X4 [Taeniopygia guttata]